MKDKTSSHEAMRIRWRDLEPDHPMALLERRRVHGQKMTAALVKLERGFKIEPHSHPEEQIAFVLSGKIRFLVGTIPDQKELIVGRDELLMVPPGIPHGAEALEETLVLDLFSPPAAATGLDTAGG